MIASLLDSLALWWLDRRTTPTKQPVLVRFIGGPLDGETHDTGSHATPVHAHYWADGDWHTYRADGTTDRDGAKRLCYDPQEGQ